MDSKKKILIIGGDSNIGKSFSSFLKNKKKKFAKTTRRKKNKFFLDLNRTQNFKIPKNISAAVIFAYQNNISFCEENYKKAFKINVTNTSSLIEKFLLKKIFVLFISTNLVFNNSKKKRFEKTFKKPVTNYGFMKSICEDKIQNFSKINKLNNYLSILRISKVLSSDLDPVKSWKKNVEKKKICNVPSDIFCCPIDMDSLNRTIYKILNNSHSGIFHLTGLKEYNYFSLAKKIFNNSHLFCPIYSKDLNKKIYNSKIKTFLSVGKVSKKIGIKKVSLSKVKNEVIK